MPYTTRQTFAIALGFSLAVHAGSGAWFARHGSQAHDGPQAEAVTGRITVALAAHAPEPKPAPPPAEAAPLPAPLSGDRPAPPARAPKLSSPVARPVTLANQAEPERDSRAGADALAAGGVTTPPARHAVPAPGWDDYLARLLAHIDRHKFYPRNARRRGLEGTTQVSFRLQEGGGVQALRVEGDNRVLRVAAEQAVRSALPLPLPPGGEAPDGAIAFSMAYRLH